jgi:protein TonB
MKRSSHRREIVRWTACFTLAAAMHAAGAFVVLAKWDQSAEAVASSPVIMIDLAPIAVAPLAQPVDVAPGPEQTQPEPPTPDPDKDVVETPPEPEKVEPVRTANLPDPAVVLPPPRPVEKKEAAQKPKKKRSAALTAPSAADVAAPQAAAPLPGATSSNAAATASWQRLLAAALERKKNYPHEARSRGEQGTATLAFRVDRAGNVHGAHIARSSGVPALDRETLELVQRAVPLPPPPPDMPGSQIPISVPIRYSIK